jgi:hypothetical protein
MMKKLLFLSIAVFTFNFGAKSQNQEGIMLQTNRANPAIKESSTPASNQPGQRITSAAINDTLHYFFSKHYYKNSTTPASAPANLSFYTIKSPYTSTLNIDHCGAIFLNSSNITVHGLTGLVMKNPGSPSTSVPVKLYLCNVNAFFLPVMPPLDSVLTSVSVSTAGVWAGGTFTAPINISGNFAVLFNKGNTASPSDTVRLFLNNALTATATSSPANQRFGEGLGLIRFNGNFQSTTNAFSGTTGNDYEFIVAPYVSYNINAGASAGTPSICNNSLGSFTNTSNPVNLIENRQFNFNKFNPYWSSPSSGGTNSLMPTTDSIYNWTFTGSSTGSSTSKNPTAYFNTLGMQSAALTVKQACCTIGLGTLNATDLATATIVVNNGSAPNISVSGTTTFCTNSSITTTLYATGNPTYTWTAPLNTVASVVVITQSLASVVYTVLAGNGGCTAVKTVTVSVNAIPNVSLSAGKSTVCSSSTGGTVALAGLPAGGTFSGLHVSGNAFNIPGSAGTFTAMYSFTNAATGCTNTASTSIIVTSCSGLSQLGSNQNVLVYPNPSQNGIVSVKNLEGTNTLEVYNILGLLVLKQVNYKEEVQIDLSSEPNGNYFLKIIGPGGDSKTLKIVNQN